MRIQRKLKPGQAGTKKLTAQYGSQLVCVRYRYDAQHHKRYKTAEIIIEEGDWNPRSRRFKDADTVGVRVAFKEVELQRQVRLAGGKWNPARRVWELRYDAAVKLRLQDRIERQNGSNSGKK